MNLRETLIRNVPGKPLFARNLFYQVLLKYYEQKNTILHDGFGQWDCIVSVNPDKINYITYSPNGLDYSHGYLDVGAFDIVTRSGATLGGDWDTKKVEFEELQIYESVKQRFIEGRSWQETPYYQFSYEEIESGKRTKGITTLEQLDRKCDRIDELFYSIRDHGYKSQSELGKVPVAEVTVNIGRDGTFFFNDGRHRLSIAKVLGISEIPVRVLVVHEDYPTTEVSEQPLPVSVAQLLDGSSELSHRAANPEITDSPDERKNR